MSKQLVARATARSFISLTSVHEVELADLISSQQGVMVLGPLHVYAVELCNCGILINDLAVAEEPPHLTQCHGKALFALLSLNLA